MMKRRSSRILRWLLAAVICLTVVCMPILAAGGGSEAPDAVAGSRGTLYGLVSTRRVYGVYTSCEGGGLVTASLSDAAPGKTVRVTAAPDAGYSLSSIAVVTASGGEVRVVPDGADFTFTMPSDPVVVSVSFQYNRT